MSKNKLIFKLAFFILLALGLSITVQKIFQIDFGSIDRFVEQFGALAPVIYSFMLFLGLTIPFNPISDYLLVNIAAFLFSPAIAILVTFVAHSFSISVNYFLARKFGKKIISNSVKSAEIDILNDILKKLTPSKIFILRCFLPLTAIGIDIVSYSAGISRMKFITFFTYSMIPWTLLSAIFFISTRYFIDLEPYLFFIPGVILIITSLIIYQTFRDRINEK